MNISNPSAMVDFIIFIKLGESKMDVVYCDNCAVPLKENEQYSWNRSPIDFDSGFKGESAVFCTDCNEEVSDED